MTHNKNSESSYRLILASGSPRRKELLSAAGYDFSVEVSTVEEKRNPGESPEAYSQRNALAKATDVMGRLLTQSNSLTQNDVVIGADTIVVLDHSIVLEKPIDDADAFRMLRLLSGRSHVVMTGFVILSSLRATIPIQKLVKTEVVFRKLDDLSIRRYISTGEPRDKSGSYAAQGFGACLIQSVHGSYTNVIGLPVAEVIEELQRF